MTIEERTILRNQYRILALLNPKDKDHYEAVASAFDMGYTGSYSAGLVEVPKEMSYEACVEVWNILTMWSDIEHTLNDGMSEDTRIKYREKGLSFAGLYETDYYYAMYLINDMHKWTELKPIMKESRAEYHHRLYREMLMVYNKHRDLPHTHLGSHVLDALVDVISKSRSLR